MASTPVIKRKRTRGPNKQTPWSRNAEDGLSVLRLEVDTTDPVQRRRLEAMFSSAFEIRCAVQGDARARVRAYRAAVHERERDVAAVRARLGLTRTSLERAAYAHLDAAPHLRRGITKALAMHLADSVWTGLKRHLFRDASGKTHGMPRIGRWHQFTRLPGRAQSHTEQHKWETFRLHGTLTGHRAAYTDERDRFFQPRRMRAVEPDGSWWRHDGPLAIVFSGLPDGALVLPVRLPSAPSNQPILDHHLGDPTRWHKVDLVRRQDPNVCGGWRYEAHLVVLTKPYVAPATLARRSAAAIATADRRAGIDVNVSNITVASCEGERDLRVTRIERSARTRQRSHRRARQERRRHRDLERSRRAANAAQYELSKRQAKRARRREAAGLPPRQVIPLGPRKSRADGKPVQSYRNDQVSRSFRRLRAAQVAGAASAAQARRDDARRTASVIVQEHGFQLTVEDCDLRSWARRWGRSLAAFSPGTILSAIEREATAVASVAGVFGGVLRAATRTTALSQHCLCGHRVSKTLGERSHECPSCGLRGDRDVVSATLAAHVVFGDRSEPASAVVDFQAARALLDALPKRSIDYRILMNEGRQDARSESNAHTARDGFSVEETERTPPHLVVVARRTVGMASPPTPDETGLGQTTSERWRTRTNPARWSFVAPIWGRS